MMDRTSLRIACIALLCALAVGSPPHRQKRSRMCYDDLGCFSTDAPFNNTDGLPPQSPQFINTTFRLFTRTCRVQRIVSLDSTDIFDQCGFDPSKPIKFIVHGFLQHGQVRWVSSMAAAFLVQADMNVLSVDWGSGSGFPYSQASANTRVVGAEIARFINFLQSLEGISLDKVHVIGHSLGAHVAGYTGQLVPGLGRITGLDPAEPDFRDTDNVVHLDKSDANFVDIIHSDGSEFDYVSGFGWMKEVGHIDFYPNGGEFQPGCPRESARNIISAAYYHGFEDAEDVLSCSHSRSIYLFTESITSHCSFFGHPCKSLAALDSNQDNCLRCNGGVCPQMGYNADKTMAEGKFYLRTRGASPYCGYTQHVEVEFGTMTSTRGEVRVELVGTDQTSDAVAIESGRTPFISGDRRETLFIDRERFEQVSEVRLTFRRPSSFWWWSSPSGNPVVIYKVTVTSASDGRSVHFCGDHRQLNNGNTITLRRSTTDPNECQLAPFSAGFMNN